jgi:hypothetical protein
MTKCWVGSTNCEIMSGMATSMSDNQMSKGQMVMAGCQFDR